MLKYEQVKGKEGQFKSLVGMSVEEFDWLHNYYEMEWNSYIAHYTLSGVPRIRSHTIRKDGKPENSRDQLLCILHYLKSPALQEHHGRCLGDEPATGKPLDTPVSGAVEKDAEKRRRVAGAKSG